MDADADAEAPLPCCHPTNAPHAMPCHNSRRAAGAAAPSPLLCLLLGSKPPPPRSLHPQRPVHLSHLVCRHPAPPHASPPPTHTHPPPPTHTPHTPPAAALPRAAAAAAARQPQPTPLHVTQPSLACRVPAWPALQRVMRRCPATLCQSLRSAVPSAHGPVQRPVSIHTYTHAISGRSLGAHPVPHTARRCFGHAPASSDRHPPRTHCTHATTRRPPTSLPLAPVHFINRRRLPSISPALAHASFLSLLPPTRACTRLPVGLLDAPLFRLEHGTTWHARMHARRLARWRALSSLGPRILILPQHCALQPVHFLPSPLFFPA